MCRSIRMTWNPPGLLLGGGYGGDTVAHFDDRVPEPLENGTGQQRVDFVVLGEQHFEASRRTAWRAALALGRRRRDRRRSRLPFPRAESSTMRRTELRRTGRTR